ncbi:NADH dehydrogenase [ubiquinone] 1 beta subcomplex subunit 3-like, partial [Rattus rattus]|uniref:NADH dehydrogenase [ubiquinone] 1 beta subcomplex subunit 3-like n=1 Tax=Rattus rattus TaxID=10117 RepID=UPI0013F2D835
LSDIAAGCGHEHGHGHGKVELPDYRQRNTEEMPLEMMQKKLAARGLRDPWTYNEAWRYMGDFASNITCMSVIVKGLKLGFAAFVVALGAEYFLASQNEDKIPRMSIAEESTL